MMELFTVIEFLDDKREYKKLLNCSPLLFSRPEKTDSSSSYINTDLDCMRCDKPQLLANVFSLFFTKKIETD